MDGVSLCNIGLWHGKPKQMLPDLLQVAGEKDYLDQLHGIDFRVL